MTHPYKDSPYHFSLHKQEVQAKHSWMMWCAKKYLLNEGEFMEYIYWGIVIFCMAVAFVGLVYPVIPSVIFLGGSFILYGLLFSFAPFNVLFWSVQIIFILLIFGSDYLSNLIGVKKYGGSKAGIWGSTIGLIIGPFIVPIWGILIGPFLGAILAEMLVHKTNIRKAIKVGIGSVIGFISSVIVKGVIYIIMIAYFFYQVL